MLFLENMKRRHSLNSSRSLHQLLANLVQMIYLNLKILLKLSSKKLKRKKSKMMMKFQNWNLLNNHNKRLKKRKKKKRNQKNKNLKRKNQKNKKQKRKRHNRFFVVTLSKKKFSS